MKHKNNKKHKYTQVTADNDSCKKAFVNTLLTMLGVYVAFLIMILFDGISNVTEKFFETQASLAGLYVNMLAVVTVVYGKFSAVNLIKVKTFFLSVIALFVTVNIFVQALYMLYPMIWNSSEWFQSGFMACILQIIYVCMIYMLSSQKEMVYKKNRIR